MNRRYISSRFLHSLPESGALFTGKLFGALLFALLLFAFLVFTKKIHLNSYWAKAYPVQGIDVSHYQGLIDWQTLQAQNIRFAFIKATEGSASVDECFADNWNGISQTELYAGAYHFFSFDSPASSQAALFIETVGDLEGKLPPVVDVEYYGNKRQNPPDKEEIAESLRELLTILEDEYGVKPILYTTYPVYRKYIKGSFDDYPLWIRNVYYTPDLTPGLGWQFWQYSDTAVLDGYQGDEACIDMNAFWGTEAQLKQYLVQSASALK